jgi:hypothetical protein
MKRPGRTPTHAFDSHGPCKTHRWRVSRTKGVKQSLVSRVGKASPPGSSSQIWYIDKSNSIILVWYQEWTQQQQNRPTPFPIVITSVPNHPIPFLIIPLAQNRFLRTVFSNMKFLSWFLVPGTWSWYMVPGTWYVVRGTWYLVPST